MPRTEGHDSTTPGASSGVNDKVDSRGPGNSSVDIFATDSTSLNRASQLELLLQAAFNQTPGMHFL